MSLISKISDADNGIWKFPDPMGSLSLAGFVYVVYDTIMHQAYIGKKSYVSRAGGRTASSDWRRYKTSSPLLKELMAQRPITEFEFIVLDHYKAKGALAWGEVWTQVYCEVPTNKRFYNTRVEGISWPVKEPVSERHKLRLEEILERMRNNQ